jgi:hypothetical protein
MFFVNGIKTYINRPTPIYDPGKLDRSIEEEEIAHVERQIGVFDEFNSIGGGISEPIFSIRPTHRFRSGSWHR